MLSRVQLEKFQNIFRPTKLKNQIEVLNSTFKNFVSNERIPMLVVGQNPISLKKTFNAQTAAIISFSIFSSKILFN